MSNRVSPPSPEAPDQARTDDRAALASLAATVPELVRLGTSTWTYPGWVGLVYQSPYPRRNIPGTLLREYAAYPLFRTVGIDHSFYRPLDAGTLAAYRAALPPGFRCVSKAWNRITSPVLAASSRDAGRYAANPDFLHAGRFTDEVVAPLVDHFTDHLGPIILEFESLARAPWLTPELFLEHLDRFLDRVPRAAPYAVEVRNPALLTPAYFAVLRAHGVAHCYNAWTAMPSIGEQLDLADSVTADVLVCRALLTPGRRYPNAVRAFTPYDRVRQPAPETRADLVRLMTQAVALRLPLYLLVNNRLEGSAPGTIRAVAERWAEAHPVTENRAPGPRAPAPREA